MSAAVFNYDLDTMLRNGFATVRDPGASGTLAFANKGLAIFEIVSAGAESRALESATNYAVGTRVLVVGKTLGGDVTITGAESSIVLTDAGNVAEFVVSLSGNTKVWRLVSYAATPVDFGTVTVNTGDAGSDSLIAAIANVLIDTGLATGTVTA